MGNLKTVRDMALELLPEGVQRSFDYALPQEWVNMAADKLDMDVRGHFVWLYDNRALIMGRPFPLTCCGRVMLRVMNRTACTCYRVDQGAWEPEHMEGE